MGHIQKILVPMDGSPPSVAALWEAVTLAEELQAAIDVLHVNGPNRFEVGSATATAPSAAEQVERQMDEAIRAAQVRLGERLSRRTDSGDPIRKILDVASTGQFDLIVMGTHGRIGRLHSLVGSVAEAVVRSSLCPVLTVRRSDGEQESFSERIHGRQAVGDPGRTAR
jgi:nucleotide-binding universal stress UspA family protein